MRAIILLLICTALLCSCGLSISQPHPTPDTSNLQGQILYFSSPTSLAILSKDGLRPVARIYDSPQACAITEDGTHIAYVSDFRIWVIDNESSSPYAVPSELVTRKVAWSPDGTHLAFSTSQTFQVFDVATNSTTVLTTTIDEFYREIDWIDNNSLILSTGYGLWTFDLSKNNLERVASPIEQAFAHVEFFGEYVVETPVISHDGQMGAYVWVDRPTFSPWDSSIRIHDLKTGRLLYEITRPGKTIITALAWSPDDRQLVLAEYPWRKEGGDSSQELGKITLTNLDGSQSTEIGEGLGVDIDWSR